MTVSISDYQSHDQQIWEEELQEFIPDRVFDAHIHMLDPKHLSAPQPTAFSNWSYADLASLRAWAARLYPGREVHFFSARHAIAGHRSGGA